MLVDEYECTEKEMQSMRKNWNIEPLRIKEAYHVHSSIKIIFTILILFHLEPPDAVLQRVHQHLLSRPNTSVR